MKLLRMIVKLNNLLSSFSSYISIASLAIMVVICIIEVFSRTFLNKPIVIIDELLPWLMICLSFMGTSWTLSTNGHIKITMLVEHFSPKLQKLLNAYVSFVSTVCICFFCIWVWNGLLDHYTQGTIGFTLHVWWAWVPMFIGAVALFLQFFVMLMNSVKSLFW